MRERVLARPMAALIGPHGPAISFLRILVGGSQSLGVAVVQRHHRQLIADLGVLLKPLELLLPDLFPLARLGAEAVIDRVEDVEHVFEASALSHAAHGPLVDPLEGVFETTSKRHLDVVLGNLERDEHEFAVAVTNLGHLGEHFLGVMAHALTNLDEEIGDARGILARHLFEQRPREKAMAGLPVLGGGLALGGGGEHDAGGL